MPRNKCFPPSHEPFRSSSQNFLTIQPQHTSGPFSFLNPTRAAYKHTFLPDDKFASFNNEPSIVKPNVPDEEQAISGKHEQLASNVEFKWRSRDNRKGRHTLVFDPPSDPSNARYITPNSTSSLREAGKGFVRMATQYPYWDISYLVATMFTLGSVVWVINAFFAWLPLVRPSTNFHNELLVGGGITAFIGATIFEIGSVLLMFEAVNENRAGCFGWALETVLEGNEKGSGKFRLRPDKNGCAHHHTNKGNIVGKSDIKISPEIASFTSSDSLTHDYVVKPSDSPEPGKSWVWFPSIHELKTNYFRELGFLASLSQFCGATIFWLSGFTALPGINNKMSQGLLDGMYWTPQIIGGTGFIISGVLFMLETQKSWYLPAYKVLGWHIGFWNLIGAIGFTLCGALGAAYGNTGAQYEASLATFWGSWAFLIGSVVQWYESLDKHPVEERGKDD